MVTDDGDEVGFHGEYREIVSGERLVSTEVYEGIPHRGDACRARHADVERVRRPPDDDLACRAPTKEGRDAHIASGMEDGLTDALVLLEEVAVSLR